jgi:hypothetical protein
MIYLTDRELAKVGRFERKTKGTSSLSRAGPFSFN